MRHPGFSLSQDDCDWLKEYRQAKVFFLYTREIKVNQVLTERTERSMQDSSLSHPVKIFTTCHAKGQLFQDSAV